MKLNQWTLGLAAIGLVSLTSAARAEEKVTSLMTAVSSTTLSGYVDTSAQWNFGTGNANNPLYSFGGPTKADGFNLNVVKLTLERAADETNGWGAGYKVDLLFGPDANGLGTQSTTGAGSADFAVKQAYVDLKVPVLNGLEFKIGVFDTIIGYEVFESGNNPNFTRSYGYTIEPTTHTGVLMAYQVNEMLSFNVGVADTFGPTINGRAFNNGTTSPFVGFDSESYKTYLASIAFTVPTNCGWAAGSTLYGCIINGFNSAAPAAGGARANQTSYYVGSTLNTPIKALKLGAAYDYAGVGNENRFGITSGYANAAALYATFAVNDKFSLNGRFEYFSQSKANAIAGLPSKVFAYTLTAEYDLWKNVMSRVEFRWDHQADGRGRAYGANGADPILGGSVRNAYELIANVIYKF